MSGAVATLGFALLVAFLSKFLGDLGFKGAKLISSVGITGMLILTVALVGESLAELDSIIHISGVSEVARLALKIVGVGYTFGASSDICLELGERGIAAAVLGVGRVEILLLAVPSIVSVIELALDIIGG